ncbi:MAG: caspase family protein [Burkholderiaceae bacterium]
MAERPRIDGRREPQRWRRTLVAACAGMLALAARPRRAKAAGTSVERGRRMALVIGVGGYRSGRLVNPVNDARLMANTLREIGFVVSQHEDVPQYEMLDEMRDWLVKSRDADVRLFYFAGHGLQSRGRNYLVPVDARVEAGESIYEQSINLSSFVSRLSQFRQGVNIVILDACRNLPPALYARGPRTRSTSPLSGPGLNMLPAPRGTLVAFATAPGAVAADGVGQANSAYTKYLARLLKVPGLPLEQVFKRVRQFVMQETRDAQTPWESSSLVGDVCLRPLESGGCGAVDVVPGRGRVVNMNRLGAGSK